MDLVRSSILFASLVGVGASSCGTQEVEWTHATCARSTSPLGGALAKDAMVRADTKLWAHTGPRMGIAPLPATLPAGDLAFRVWHSTTVQHVQSGLELQRTSGVWRAQRWDRVELGARPAETQACTDLRRGVVSNMCVRPLALPENWALTWQALESVGLTRFEGDARLDGQRTRAADAKRGWWFVEIREGDAQHAYAFTDPGGEACRQPEAFTRALRVLADQLSWGSVFG